MTWGREELFACSFLGGRSLGAVPEGICPGGSLVGCVAVVAERGRWPSWGLCAPCFRTQSSAGLGSGLRVWVVATPRRSFGEGLGLGLSISCGARWRRCPGLEAQLRVRFLQGLALLG